MVPGTPGRAALPRIGAALALALSASCAPPAPSGFIVTDIVTGIAAPAANLSSTQAPATPSRNANFRAATPSSNARLVANWVVGSGDNQNLPFAVIDKIGAKVYIFGADGNLRGATFALLGLAHGDDTAPGIGAKKLSAITPRERTTPAGRFVGELGVDAGQSVFWIDYGAAIAMHPVVAGSPGDHRFARLASPSPLDKRITFGCINVPANFYNNIVATTFSGTAGIVYILPETKPLQDVFPIKAPAGRSIGQVALRIP